MALANSPRLFGPSNATTQQVVMVGKVEKRFLFENPRLDLRVLRGLSRCATIAM
jgi:hypothetical protein